MNASVGFVCAARCRCPPIDTESGKMSVVALAGRTISVYTRHMHCRVNSWAVTMRNLTFDELFTLLSPIPVSAAGLARLREWLAAIKDPAECIALIEEAAGGRPCPHCHCPRSHRCGHASGLQRFRCVDCRRSFNALTGTPLARLRKKECWLAYLQCMLDSHTVRQAAAATGVHLTTSFRWRHRFVPGAARERSRRLRAIVEADET